MRLRRPHNLGGKLTTGVAIAVLLLLLGSFALFSGFTSSDSESFGGGGISPTELPALTLGSSREEIEAQLGKGEDALGFIDTGVALEPMEARCVYYYQSGSDLSRVVQLCYREDRLVRKQTYGPPSG
jgi:hypothetical protein